MLAKSSFLLRVKPETGTWDDKNPIEIADEGTRIAPEKNDRLVMLGMTFILECPSNIPKRGGQSDKLSVDELFRYFRRRLEIR